MAPNFVPAGAGEHTYADDPKAYGHVIRMARQQARLTQIELAALLRIPKTTLSEIECGYQLTPAPDTLAVIAEWLETRPGEPPAEELGPRLSAAREAAQLSLEALSTVSGVSKSSIKRIEQGARPSAGVRAQIEAWLAGKPQASTRNYVRGPRVGRGPDRYFIAYDHSGGPANTILEMSAAPVSIDQVRQLEKHIAAQTGHSGVCVRSWQPVRP